MINTNFSIPNMNMPQIGRRNKGTTPVTMKTQLLNLRAEDNRPSQRPIFTPLREIAKSEAAKREEEQNSKTLTTLRDKLKYIESRIPKFHQREIILNELQEGKHNMSLSIGNQNINLSIKISDTDTIQDVQQRIADEINALQHNDVYASIFQDSETNETRLFVNFRKTTVRDAIGNDSYGTSAVSPFMNLNITSAETGQQTAQLLMEVGRDHGFDSLHGFAMLLTDFQISAEMLIWERGEIVGVNWDIFEEDELLDKERLEEQSELVWRENMDAFLERYGEGRVVDRLL